MNYIKELEEIALGSRLKQLSDVIMVGGKRIYQESNIDFEPTWFPVFRLLSENAPLGVVEIAAQLGVSHPHVIKITKALEKKGLVTNDVNTTDARKRAIRLSVKGEQLLPHLEVMWIDIETALKELLLECRNNLMMSLIEVENGLNRTSLFDRFERCRRKRQMDAVEIVPFTPELAHHFKDLNIEWLEKYFVVESIDVKVLSNPYKEIVQPGGDVLFAIFQGEVVGTCALKKEKEGFYELSKMAVTERAKGLQIGKKLGLAIIELAKKRNAETLFLESNKKLIPALSLYRKLGFVEMPKPELSSFYERSDIYMELKF